MCSTISHTQRNISQRPRRRPRRYTHTSEHFCDWPSRCVEAEAANFPKCIVGAAPRHVHAQYWSRGAIMARPVHIHAAGESQKKKVSGPRMQQKMHTCVSLSAATPLILKFIANCRRGRINKYVDARAWRPKCSRLVSIGPSRMLLHFHIKAIANICTLVCFWINSRVVTWWVDWLLNPLDARGFNLLLRAFNLSLLLGWLEKLFEISCCGKL